MSHKIIEINSMRNMTNQNIIYITTIRRSLVGNNGERKERAGRTGKNKIRIRVKRRSENKPQNYHWNRMEMYKLMFPGKNQNE